MKQGKNIIANLLLYAMIYPVTQRVYQKEFGANPKQPRYCNRDEIATVTVVRWEDARVG